MAERQRRALIDSIMTNRFGDDDPKYDGKNRAFLEGLSLDELEELCDEVIDEDLED